jgi:RecB family exonuclease
MKEMTMTTSTPSSQPVKISNSEMDRWKRCPRQWFVEYYLGYLPADPSPVSASGLGKRVHTAMEGRYGYDLDPLVVLAVLYAAELEAHPDWEKELNAEHELAKIMIEGWFKEAQEQGWEAGLNVIATEAEVAVPLPGFEGAVLLRGKLDQVTQDGDGVMRFLDWKTAQDFMRDEMTEMDPQMQTYALIQWLAAGHPVPAAGQPFDTDPDLPVVLGGIINTMRKVKRTRQSKPPYYSSHRFLFSPERLAAKLAGVQQVAAEIMNARYQLDAAYAAGGDAGLVNHLQRTICRPVEIPTDCAWRCSFSSGLCQLMSAGTGWIDALVSSGKYRQGDPYERYTRQGVEALKEALGR